MGNRSSFILDGGVFLSNKEGFVLHEAFVVIALCSVMILNLMVLYQVQKKREELMNSIEQQINQSWEEIFSSFQECEACLVEEEIETDPS